MTFSNYNLVSHQGLLPLSTLTPGIRTPILNARAKLDTGTHCNYDCGFCYYSESLHIKTPLTVILERLDYLHRGGMTSIDLSGGESSIHKDFFEILRVASHEPYNFKSISTLTNGSRFADPRFMEKATKCGLTEILFSVHGSTAPEHDAMVRRPGAFVKILRAIELCKEFGLIARINSTVTMENYKGLPVLSDLIGALETPIMEVNFLPLNHWDDAQEEVPIDYSLVAPQIQDVILKLDSRIPVINVRYIPYCYMENFEKYVCSYYQHIWDPWDWNMALYPGTLDAQDYSKDSWNKMMEAAKQNRNHSYKKPRSCMDCSRFLICDGIENENPLRLPDPIKGPWIKDPIHFRPGHYEVL